MYDTPQNASTEATITTPRMSGSATATRRLLTSSPHAVAPGLTRQWRDVRDDGQAAR